MNTSSHRCQCYRQCPPPPKGVREADYGEQVGESNPVTPEGEGTEGTITGW